MGHEVCDLGPRGPKDLESGHDDEVLGLREGPLTQGVLQRVHVTLVALLLCAMIHEVRNLLHKADG